MAFYDLNVAAVFRDFSELEDVQCTGYCLCYRIDDIGTALAGTKEEAFPGVRKPVYTRLDIEYSGKMDHLTMNHLRSLYNLVCVTTSSVSNIQTILKLEPDMIRIDNEQIKHIRKSLSGSIREKGVFVELVIRDALYDRKTVWMNACRRLLRVGCRRQLILSSGATMHTELKGEDDVCKILAIFGVAPNIAKQVAANTERLLRTAALRRYSAEGAITNSVDRGVFKRDFIIDYK